MAALQFIAMGAQLAGGAIAAKGQKMQGEADSAALRYNAQISQEDARIAASQAAADTERQKRENIVRQGRAVAAAGASGGISGSNLDILSSNAAEQELDILNIQHQSKLQQRSLLNSANLDLSAAENVKKQSKLSASATLISSVGNAASSYARK